MKFKNSINMIIMSVFVLILQACVSTGQRIDTYKVSSIQKRVTTEADIRAMFGEPVGVRMNMKRGVKVLSYGYKNDDSIKKAGAGVAGAVVGGVLGHQIGGGSGQALATGVGAMVGSFLASNAVTARRARQYLEVTIGLKSGKVIDYNYIESKGRSQRIGVTSGVAPL